MNIRVSVVLAFAFLSTTAFGGDLPDPKKIPGDALPVTKAQICQQGYTACVRHVTPAKAKAVYEIIDDFVLQTSTPLAPGARDAVLQPAIQHRVHIEQEVRLQRVSP